MNASEIQSLASKALAKICAADASNAVAACSMRRFCQTSTDASGCADSTLFADACTFDAVLPPVASSGVCGLLKTCGAGCTTTPNMVSTTTIESHLISVCSLMNMEECSACTLPPTASPSTLPSCDILSTYGSVCRVMDGMTDCSLYSALCTSSYPASLSPLCLGGSSDGGGTGGVNIIGGTPSQSTTANPYSVPIMRMYFHTGTVEYVLFKGFVPQSQTEFVGACLLTIVLGVLMAALESARMTIVMARKDHVSALKAARRLAKKTQRASDSPPGTAAVDVSSDNNPESEPAAMRPMRFLSSAWTYVASFVRIDWTRERYQVAKCGVAAAQVTVSYLLMLIVMQFNVALFCCAIVGVFLGKFVFDRVESEEGVPTSGCCE